MIEGGVQEGSFKNPTVIQQMRQTLLAALGGPAS
jgi:hypothetical protein